MKDEKIMLNLTFREIKLLNLFLNNDMLTISELRIKCGISSRTLDTEFLQINKVLLATGHQSKIINQRGKGYLLAYPLTETEWIEFLKQNCSEYLNLSFNCQFGNNLRIAKICRFLCSNQGYIKMDQLAKKLHFSSATLNKDMPSVKTFLSKYKLKLKSVPYHGMKLLGSAGAIRSCLIDLFDVYNFSKEQTLLPEHAFNEYGINKQDLYLVSSGIQKVIEKSNFPLTDAGFKATVKYLLIYKLRPDIVPKMSLTEKNELVKTKAFFVAKQLLAGSLAEQLFLATFLITNVEIQQIPDLKSLETWSKETTLQVKQLFQTIRQNFALNLSRKPNIAKYIYHACLIRYIKKKYHFSTYNIMLTNRLVARKLLATMSLTVILDIFCLQYDKNDFEDALFTEVVLDLYNIICHEKNEYRPTKFLVVNDNGKLASERIIRKLELKKYNVSYDFLYSYQLSKVDYTKYDFLLISSTNRHKSDCLPIPKITFTFFLSDRFRIMLWQRILSTKRKIGPIVNYLKAPMIIELSVSKHTVQREIINNLIEQLKVAKNEQPLFTYYVKALIANEDVKNYPFNMYLTLLGPHDIDQRYFIFRFKQPVILHQRKISNLQIVILDLSKGLLEIKNGDSELRRYFNVIEND